MKNVFEFVKHKLATGFGVFAREARKLCQAAHMPVIWNRSGARAKSAPPCDPLQGGLENPRAESALKTLMIVPDLPQFFAYPACLPIALEAGQLLFRIVLLYQRFQGCLGGEHPTLHGQVNSFQALRV